MTAFQQRLNPLGPKSGVKWISQRRSICTTTCSVLHESIRTTEDCGSTVAALGLPHLGRLCCLRLGGSVRGVIGRTCGRGTKYFTHTPYLGPLSPYAVWSTSTLGACEQTMRFMAIILVAFRAFGTYSVWFRRPTFFLQACGTILGGSCIAEKSSSLYCHVRDSVCLAFDYSRWAQLPRPFEAQILSTCKYFTNGNNYLPRQTS